MPVEFIAEVSSNHNGDLKRCLEFVRVAADIGCSAVKFQLFKADKLFAPQILQKSPLHRKRKDWQLPEEFLPRIKMQCRRSKIRFGCTPFYLDAVKVLEPFVDFYKISSYELLRKDLIRACALTGKPVVLSTGMANLLEVKRAVNALKAAQAKDYCLLHCVSSYPAALEDCNLSAIKTLRDAFKCKVGWSDHTIRPEVLLRAIGKWEADIIEFHLDIAGKGKEYHLGHCWLPQPMAKLISKVKGAEANCRGGLTLSYKTLLKAMDGNGIKKPSSSESNERLWRADPKDGLRPLKRIRKTWQNHQK